MKYRIEWNTGSRWETVAVADQPRRARRTMRAKHRQLLALEPFATWRAVHHPPRLVQEVFGRLRAVPCPAGMVLPQLYVVDPLTRKIRTA